MSTPAPTAYPARLEVDYPDRHNRVTTLFRVVLVIPIAIVYRRAHRRRDQDGLRPRAARRSARRAAASPPACSWRPC